MLSPVGVDRIQEIESNKFFLVENHSSCVDLYEMVSTAVLTSLPSEWRSLHMKYRANFFFRCPPCLLRASVAYHFFSHNYRKEESMWRVCSCLEYKIYWMDSRCLACPAPCWRFTNGGNTRNRFPWMRSTSASRIFKSSLSSGTSSNKSAKENVIQSSTSAVAFSPTPPCVVRA